MTDRRIIFSAPMVRALLDDRKTMTRRLAWQSYRTQKLQPLSAYATRASPWQSVEPGDRLWVRETHWRLGRWVKDGLTKTGRQRWRFKTFTKHDQLFYTPAEAYRGTIRGADQPACYWKRPSIFMPRWASRLTLVVTETKLERVQDISVDDAWAEGVERRSKKVRQMWLYGASEGERSDIYRRAAKWEFQDLWNTLHKPSNRWEDNPEVVALTFTAHKTNIDRLEAAKQ